MLQGTPTPQNTLPGITAVTLGHNAGAMPNTAIKGQGQPGHPSPGRKHLLGDPCLLFWAFCLLEPTPARHLPSQRFRQPTRRVKALTSPAAHLPSFRPAVLTLELFSCTEHINRTFRASIWRRHAGPTALLRQPFHTLFNNHNQKTEQTTLPEAGCSAARYFLVLCVLGT